VSDDKTLDLCRLQQRRPPRGRLRLNCIGTIQDLARLGVRLQEGLKVSLHDEEMEAEGEVHYSGEERIWVAKIDWESIRQTST
jgi:hypothetical protein